MELDPVYYTKPLQRHIDTMLAEPAFNELLDLVVETCLTSRGRYERAHDQIRAEYLDTPLSEEMKVLRQLGSWGVRTAASIVDTPYRFFYPKLPESLTEEEVQLARSNLLDPTSPIETPQIFGGSADMRIAHKIEALGKSIIDEAFICLGEDAYDKVLAWQQATNLEEKSAVASWLIDRVAQINPQSLFDDTEETSFDPETYDMLETSTEPAPEPPFYHPARLSPRLLGQFPDVAYEPTCLMRSILVAAFFEKAGIPYLHAGVAISASQGARRGMDTAIDRAKSIVASWGLELPDEPLQLLNTSKRNSRKILHEDRGVHAAVVGKISENEWLEVDVNYSIYDLITKEDAEKLQQAFQDFQSLRMATPGMEYMIDAQYVLTNSLPEYLFSKMLDKSPELSDVEAFLETCSDSESEESIITQFILPLFEPMPTEHEKIEAAVASTFDEILEGTYTEYRPKLLRELLRQRVFSDGKEGDISACLARCKTDPYYRRRRAEDIKIAPVYAMIRTANQLTNWIIERKLAGSHQLLEVGSPHYRIGAAVLSDFATYTGDELPLSFWLTYWPSQVALMEHFSTAETAHQKSLIHNHFNHSLLTDLQYMRNNGILAGFLKQEREQVSPSEGGEQDDSEQG
jgi:hypothetical protein